MMRHLKMLALGTAIMLPTAEAMARADITHMDAPQTEQVIEDKEADSTVKVSPVIGLKMGMKVDFNDRVALQLESGFITGLYAGGTLKIRF